MPITPIRSPRLDGGDPAALREEIRTYFHATWETYERLFDVMAADEAWYRRADPLRHPLIFYLGHTACFFVNKLVLAKLLPERVNPRFESIFAIGVDEMSWDDLDGTALRLAPGGRGVGVPPPGARRGGQADRRPAPGAAHRLGRALLGDHDGHRARAHPPGDQLGADPPAAPGPAAAHATTGPSATAPGPAPANELLDVPGGVVVQGKPRDHRYYGWDNEYGRLETRVASFRAAKYLVSNGEFKAFIDAGGYREQRFWTEEGWGWRSYLEAEHPRFWVPDGGPVAPALLRAGDPHALGLARRGQPAGGQGLLQLEGRGHGPPGAPADGGRVVPPAGVTPASRDMDAWDETPGNLNLAGPASSVPVTENLHAGFGDVMGNVWQHTETPIAGFPGFEVHPLYDDFSTPTFDHKHNLIKGGSWISTGNEAQRDSRYAFRRHFYQHAGFRYIESEQPVELREDVYETDELVSQYCEFHYGEERFGVPNFAERCAELCRRDRRRPPHPPGPGPGLRHRPGLLRAGPLLRPRDGHRLLGPLHPRGPRAAADRPHPLRHARGGRAGQLPREDPGRVRPGRRARTRWSSGRATPTT